MLIQNCVQNDDGSLDFDFHVDGDEAAFLMDYAIKSLVFEGIIKIQSDQVEQELEIHKAQGGTVN
jgi:hypothetical protein